MALRSIRGKQLIIGPPSEPERELIWQALQREDIYVPLGLRAPVPRADMAASVLTLHRGDEVRRDPVRFHALRARESEALVGFFLDFGWDHATDPIRELDLAFPEPAERSLARYVDATFIVSQYLFMNQLAKRVRWRVRIDGHKPSRNERLGGRLVSEQEERHPVSGEWLRTAIYEYTAQEFHALMRRLGLDPEASDYADSPVTMWDALRPRQG